MSDNPLREIAEIAALSGQERYAEGRAQAFKEAAEIARERVAVLKATPRPDRLDDGAMMEAEYIAELIEARAKEKQP